MTVKELKKEQILYVASIGGHINIREADETYNNFNRAIIKTYKEENKSSFIGRINLPDDKYQALKNKKEVLILESYTGQEIYNFGADFIIPKKDEILESLIKEWNTSEGYKKGTDIIEKIGERIYEIGGIQFIWY